MMDMEDIKKVLPHRNHFLLVDAVTEIGENSASGYHEVKKDEFWVSGHFPGNPIFPGVLILELMAQVGGFAFINDINGGRFAYLSKADNVKYKRKVKIGDKIEVQAELLRRFGNYAEVKSVASVCGEKVAQANITYTFLEQL